MILPVILETLIDKQSISKTRIDRADNNTYVITIALESVIVTDGSFVVVGVENRANTITLKTRIDKILVSKHLIDRVYISEARVNKIHIEKVRLERTYIAESLIEIHSIVKVRLNKEFIIISKTEKQNISKSLIDKQSVLSTRIDKTKVIT